MADPKEDQGKYPAQDWRVETDQGVEARGTGVEALVALEAERKEREAALAGEAPGGKTGQIASAAKAEREEETKHWDHPPTARHYGPGDRQRYLQDVAERAFRYQNPLRGPLTAYESAQGGFEQLSTPLKPHEAEGRAKRMIDSVQESQGRVGSEIEPHEVRETMDNLAQLREVAQRKGMTLEQVIEAMSVHPSRREREGKWTP